ncbi:MAG TPA: hypothetical protein VFV97_02410 [Rhodanobacteraceae bacterium]|nr:hypothetical protein [Rhodanobacteraceae bacterium]
MLSLKTPVAAALALAAAFGTSACFAADGDLDPGFGTGGIAYLTPDLVDAQELQPYKAIVLPDGKLLFAGSLDAPTTVPFEQEYRGMLARFNEDGTVDAGFGNSSIPGVVALPALDPNHRMENIESIARLDDGSLIAVGISQVTSLEEGFVVRMDANGTIDTTFAGGAGFVLIPLYYAHAVGIDSQGRIVVAGESIDIGTFVYTANVMRFNADGTPDTTYGDNGTASLAWDGAGNSGYLADLIMTADDGVIVAGRYEVYGSGLGSDYAIAKLDATGTPDATFGDAGSRVFHDPSSDSFINAIQRIAATPDGGIAWAGYYYVTDSGANPLIVGHLGADGATDDAFGDAATPGYFHPAIVPTASSNYPTGLVAQPDGKLVVSATFFPGTEFLAVRSTAGGQLDPDFADGGVFEADLAPDGDFSEASALAMQPDGRIVLAGRAHRITTDAWPVDLGVVRLLNAIGPDDTIFADGFDP